MPGAPHRPAAGSTCVARRTPRPPTRPGWPLCWGCRHEPGPTATGHRLESFHVSTTGSVTPQPPGRTPHEAPQAPLRCPGGEDTPPEASGAPAREAMKRAPLVATALVLA